MTNKDYQIKIPEEVKARYEALKNKLESFKKELLKKFDKYVLGIALLPPEKPPTEDESKPTEKEKEEIKNKINILILVDDSDSKNIESFGLRDKLFAIVEKIAKETDQNFKPEVLLNSELVENCYDGKYEILNLIANSGVIYDPSDMLAAIKISQVHKSMVLTKFDKYIVSYIAAGSLFRGEKSNDIDVFILVDDTDVKKMSRFELRDRLRAIIIQLGFQAADITGVKKQFHIQVYILTDFWEWVKDASPVIFTVLRDGVPLFDKGVFMPWKLLLKMGRVKPSPESIDMHMSIGEKSITLAKDRLISVVGQDLYFGVLNPAQAALMLYGISPPTHRETIKLMNEIFVKKEKLLEKKYVDTLEKLFTIYKNIEHGKTNNITGSEVDQLLKEADAYLTRIKKLFNQIEKKAEARNIKEMFENCTSIAQEVLKLENLKATNVEAGFQVLVKNKVMPERFYLILKLAIKAKKDYEKKTITKQEVEKTRRNANIFLAAMAEYIQRKRGIELNRTRIRFKYDENKYGEVFLLDDVAFIIEDIDSKEKSIGKAKVKDGRLIDIQKSNIVELEKAMSEKNIPKQVFINEGIFEDLKKLYGKDIKISVHP